MKSMTNSLFSCSALDPFRTLEKEADFLVFKYLRHRAHLQLFLASPGQTLAAPLHMRNLTTEAKRTR